MRMSHVSTHMYNCEYFHRACKMLSLERDLKRRNFTIFYSLLYTLKVNKVTEVEATCQRILENTILDHINNFYQNSYNASIGKCLVCSFCVDTISPVRAE